MAKLTRITQRIFGSTAAAGQIGQFGSLAAGTPTTTTDAGVMQSLSNWLDGWASAILGNNSPAIEDVNAVDFVTTRQLAYLFQQGVPEWDTATTYFTGSLVSVGSETFKSLSDNNTGNDPTTDAVNWAPFGGAPAGTIHQYAGAAAPSGYLLCDGSSVLRASYPHLFAAIGTAYGFADGSHFNLPDMRRRVAVGAGGVGTGVLGNTIGSTGGEETHQLIVSEMPGHSHTDMGHSHGTTETPHSHSITDVQHNHTEVASPAYIGVQQVSATLSGATQSLIGNSTAFALNPAYTGITGTNAASTGLTINNASAALTSTGGDGAHNNMQPSIVLNFIIKT